MAKEEKRLLILICICRTINSLSSFWFLLSLLVKQNERDVSECERGRERDWIWMRGGEREREGGVLLSVPPPRHFALDSAHFCQTCILKIIRTLYSHSQKQIINALYHTTAMTQQAKESWTQSYKTTYIMFSLIVKG